MRLGFSGEVSYFMPDTIQTLSKNSSDNIIGVVLLLQLLIIRKQKNRHPGIDTVSKKNGSRF